MSDLLPVRTYPRKVLSIWPQYLVAYWPMDELAGSAAIDRSGNGRNGAYTSATLNQLGWRGGGAASFDGLLSFNNVFSTSLQSNFPTTEGTIAFWAQVSGAGVWTDAILRRLTIFQVDANNRVFAQKNATSNQLQLSYIAGGTTKTVTTSSFSPTTPFHAAITWSVAADQVKVYVNGLQSGTTQTGLGTWAGTIATNAMVVGAGNTTPLNVWSGIMQDFAIWRAPLTDAQIAALGVQ
jgi:concanavalin A-like lectin/glucanase superfamily protein